MLDWLIRNFSTIVVCVILAAIVVLIIIYIAKSRKKGGCSCRNCVMSENCGREKCGGNDCRNDKLYKQNSDVKQSEK